MNEQITQLQKSYDSLRSSNTIPRDVEKAIRTRLAYPKGLNVTITTAKLTPGGATGSMTFVNGILTAQVAAT
jgi:hypothetical protein